MRAEVEAKFLAADRDVLDALATLPALGFASLGSPGTFSEWDRYLDTADGALANRRWACRLRSRDGAHRVSLKGPAEATAHEWHHRRPEVEGPATDSLDPESWPASDARRRLLELTGGAELVERFGLRQERTERAVLVDGQPVATMSLDVVDIIEGGRERGRLLVAELELANEESLAVDRFGVLADALADRHGLTPDPRTKLEHALERLDAE
jgi:inorganic triphosphatase YgiF